MTLVSELRGDLCIVTNALQKIKKDDKKIDEEIEEKDVKDYLLTEIINLSRRNSNTHLDCQKIEQEKENGKFLDSNIVSNGQTNGHDSPDKNESNGIEKDEKENEQN